MLIPLLLEEIPTAREFKDAIKSLSPEQQRFAQAYRSMQLSSSVFGVCVVQIKPQLETLLGLPADALDKEMKLTQDLMELFVEYQVPSDLLSYNGHSESAALEDKIANVKANVKAVVDVIESQKEKQLKDERAKTDMATEALLQGREQIGSPPAQYDHHSANSRRGRARPKEAFAYRSMQQAPSVPVRSIAMNNAAPLGDVSCGSSMEFYGALDRMIDETRDAKHMSQRVVHNEDDICFSLYADDEFAESRAVCNSQNTIVAENEPPRNDIAGQGTTSGRSDQGDSITQEGVDFTLIPKQLDQSVEKSGDAASLRSTTIKTSSYWTRNRQANLLSKPDTHGLGADEIRKEKSKAFDLLDALSRSGSLAIAHSELHVVVAMTHCFEKDVMGTVICDNVNPIEKLEGSALLLASAVHGLSARELVRDANELQRLRTTMPCLLEG